MFKDIHPNYVDGVGKNRIQFDQRVDPELYHAMLSVMADVEKECDSRWPYDDVEEFRFEGALVAWHVDPDGPHNQIIFYDVKPMWRLMHDLGHFRALAQYSPRIELDALN